ncbi:MAG: phage portal protein family protein [Solirubrobacterales bacterium]
MSKRRSGASKRLTQQQALTEFGTSGVKQSGGRITDEITTILKNPRKRVEMYREIRDNSAPIGAARLAIEQLLRQVPIRVNAGSDDSESLRAFDLVKSALDDTSRSWGDTLTQSMTMLDFGFAPMEIVYKRRQGDQRDPTRRSKHTDNLIGWRKVVLRPQQTVDKWEFGDDGGIAGMWQKDPNGAAPVQIPIEKMLLMRTRDEGSPEGRSLYRNCVFPWIFSKRLSEMEAIGVERDLTGIPVMEVPERLMASDASSAEKQILAACQEIVTGVYRGENEGIVMPRSFDDKGKERFVLRLMTSGGRRSFDVGKIIERYDQRMLMCLLADFILLGHEQVGSFSLSSDKTDLFAVAIAAWLESILEVWNRFAIPRLLELNGMRGEQPTLTHGDIEKRDLAELGTFLVNAANAGVNLEDDDGSLERHIKDQAGLPLPPDDDGEMSAIVGKSARQSSVIFGSFVQEVRKLRQELKEAA